jgi:hypothetical protein
MKKLFLIASALIIITSCNKDKFQTRPQISLNTYSQTVPLNGYLDINLKYTDKEGDLGGGTFTYWPRLLNTRPLAAGLVDYTPITDTIPSFPNKNKGEIEFKLQRILIYKEIQAKPGDDKNDTMVVKIVVADRAGNKSDTLTTKPIVILGQ